MVIWVRYENVIYTSKIKTIYTVVQKEGGNSNNETVK